jgi:hypothetical protein
LENLFALRFDLIFALAIRSTATDTINYVATDNAGNTATSTRAIVVEAASGAPAQATSHYALMELMRGRRCSLLMDKERELQAVYHRERRVDEALRDTFPASDPPSFVGAGAPKPDDKTRLGKPDRDRVNIHAPAELKGWCAYWGCTPAELKVAVRDVGVMAANIEAQLMAKGHKRK